MKELTPLAAIPVPEPKPDQVYIARKISHPTRARTLLGSPGTLSSRLQPNHPTDDVRGSTLLVYWGLSLGAGDALIGLNPAVDTVENVSAALTHLDKIRRKTGVPTQICVLAHIKTQLACLQRGAPVEILFQSLGGTERTNLSEFDITVELLDHGYRTMAERGPLKDAARVGATRGNSATRRPSSRSCSPPRRQPTDSRPPARVRSTRSRVESG